MFYDNLTGLPNVILFIDRLEQALAHAARRQQQLAIIYLEIDGYARLAEKHGLQAGDEIIREVAERLSNCVRRQEDTVGRICGDQFGIILGDIDGQAGTHKVLDKISHAMRKHFLLSDRVLKVTLSAGASIYPQCGIEWSGLLRSASTAMHLVKEEGGDGYSCFGEERKDGSRAVPASRLIEKFWSPNDTQPLHAMGLQA